MGCNYAGYVQEVGEEVSNLQPGMRVSGMVLGNIGQAGAFGEHIVADSLFAAQTENLAFEKGATLGISVTAAALAIYKDLCLPVDPAENKSCPFVLVYAASTAVGTMITQLATMSGARVVATSSPENFALVSRFGAEKVFDYVLFRPPL